MPDLVTTGFVTRPPTLADAQAVTDLLFACDIAEYGSPDWTYDDTLDEWRRTGFNLATDAWVVETPNGQVVGYTNVWEKGEGILLADGYVHPEFVGWGIGTHLVELSEAWAQAHVSEHPKRLQNATYGGNVAANDLLKRHGYELIRQFWTMAVEFDVPPPAPHLADGLTIRAFDPATDAYATYAASDEAFRDHWQHVHREFEDWKEQRMRSQSFDPSLWFLAMDGAEVAGVALCRHTEDAGEISTLGVRRAWRKRGVGLALLYHAFGEFYRLAKPRITLGVDAQNPSGATRLYERAGMRVERQYTVYTKDF